MDRPSAAKAQVVRPSEPIRPSNDARSLYAERGMRRLPHETMLAGLSSILRRWLPGLQVSVLDLTRALLAPRAARGLVASGRVVLAGGGPCGRVGQEQPSRRRSEHGVCWAAHGQRSPTTIWL